MKRRCWRSHLIAMFGAVIALGVIATSSACDDGIEPLQPIPGDPSQIERDTPLVSEGRSLRMLGLAMLLVEPDFNSGVLKKYEEGVELVRDHPMKNIGLRQLVVRVDDAELDRFIEGVSREPGVVPAEKIHVWTSEMMDPTLRLPVQRR